MYQADTSTFLPVACAAALLAMVPELSLLNRADRAWDDDALLKREAVISVDDDVSVDDNSIDICDESACDCLEALKV